MSVPFEDDADRLALLQSLGGPIRLNGKVVEAILREEYVGQEVGDDQMVEASQPYLYLRESDVEGVPDDATVEEIDGRRRKFVIAYPAQPDGAGMVRLYLQDQ